MPGPTRAPSQAGTFWERVVRGVCRWHEAPHWERFVGRGWVAEIMQAAVTDRFHAKQGRSIGRWVLEANGQRLTVYLKRHYVLPRWLGLVAALWPGRGWSPALQEWRHLEWARRQGMPVPAALAAGEYIGPWGRLQSFLAVEELAGMLPLHEAIPRAARQLDPATFRRWKQGLTREMARLACALHDRRCFHKDLYLCHFYVPAEELGRVPATWRGQVHVIDLHRLGRHAWTWPLWRVKDLAQLLYSSDVAGVDARDRLRFWRAYLGPARHAPSGRWLRRGIEAKAERYRQHNAKRRRSADEQAA